MTEATNEGQPPAPSTESPGVAPSARTLKHLRVARTIQESIEQGILRPGDPLGGELQLANQLDVSRGTVRRALEELAAAGYIRTERGRGSFVTYSGERLSEGLGWARALLDLGVETEVEVLRLELMTDAALAIHLGSHRQRFLAVDRIRRLPDGHAISLERSRTVASERLITEFRENGLLGGSLSATLAAAGLHAAGGEQWIQTIELDDADARLFGVEPGAIFLHALRITTDGQGEPLEQVSSILNPAHFSFHITF